MLIEAPSLAAARRKAGKLTAFDLDWNPTAGRMVVEKVVRLRNAECGIRSDQGLAALAPPGGSED